MSFELENNLVKDNHYIKEVLWYHHVYTKKRTFLSPLK